MSLFDSLSAPKWQHRKAEVRLQAVAELDDPNVLLSLVQADPDSTVQAAALARIQNTKILDDLVENLTGTLQQQARSQRLQQLLPDPAQIKQIADHDLLLRIAELSDDEKLISDAIARIEDPAVRLKMASTHPLARIRLNAAMGIDDIETLRELMQLSRGKDKGVYRHCKALVDEYEAAQKQTVDRHQKIEQLLTEARELLSAPHFSEFKGRYLAVQQQWKTVADFVNAESSGVFAKLMAACAERLTKASEAIAAEEQAQAAAAAAQLQQESLLAELTAFTESAHAPENDEALTLLESQLADFRERWQLASTSGSASPVLEKSFTGFLKQWQDVARIARKLINEESKLNSLVQQASRIDRKDYQALQKLLGQSEKLLARLSWPDGMQNKTPAKIQQLSSALESLKSALKELDSEQPKQAKRVESLLQNLNAAMEQNHSKEADRALSKVRKSMTALSPAQRQAFENQVKPFVAQLNEVHDWQGFAIEPKKHELCASMEALMGSDEDPEMLAVKIQTLQEQWKQVGALPHTQEQELWLRFKTASDEAWKPCKEEFARRARIQRENHKRRMKVVEQLSAYDAAMAWPEAAESPESDGESKKGPVPDWPMVQKTLDAAREEFRLIQPVDPKTARQSQKVFREICDRIYGHISKEYERNIALKEQLASKAQSLAEQEDLSKAIEQAKRLQQDWKAVGMTPVKADRKLWQSFRAACDAVFQRLDEKRVQEQAAASEQIQQAEALRAQAHALLKEQESEPGPQLVSALGELRQQLYGLDIPPPVQQRLQKDFQNLEKQARDRVQQAKAHQEKAGWTTLFDFIQAAATGTNNSGLMEKLSSNTVNLPRGIDVKALQNFCQKGAADADGASSQEACIALEVLLDVDSPAKDKQARMNYQMKRLTEGLGRAVVDTDQALLEQINSFIAMRPAHEWTQRFCAVLEKFKA